MLMTILTDVNTHDVSTETAQNPNSQSSSKTIFTLEDIQKILPHRYPFALVDRIIEYVPGKRAVGIKNVTFNEPHFQGHFPGRPLMPGDQLVMTTELLCIKRRRFGKMNSFAVVDGQRVAEGELMFSLVD